jgi:hypothetical protein
MTGEMAGNDLEGRGGSNIYSKRLQDHAQASEKFRR